MLEDLVRTILFSYEQSVTPSTSWEAGIIFIGLGFAGTPLSQINSENAMGAAINMGYKFKRSPNFYFSVCASVIL